MTHNHINNFLKSIVVITILQTASQKRLYIFLKGVHIDTLVMWNIHQFEEESIDLCNLLTFLLVRKCLRPRLHGTG